jgi:hypothetical protein
LYILENITVEIKKNDCFEVSKVPTCLNFQSIDSASRNLRTFSKLKKKKEKWKQQTKTKQANLKKKHITLKTIRTFA